MDRKDKETVRIVTFNVCSIKNVLDFKPWNEKKTFQHMFEYLDADIVSFQETKIQPKDLTKDMAIIDGWDGYFVFPASKKGYSGVAVYVKQRTDATGLQVEKAESGITGCLESLDQPGTLIRDMEKQGNIGGYPEDIDCAQGKEIDSEGRCLVLDFGAFVLIALYCPANSMGDRLEYRHMFFSALDVRVRNLVDMGKQVVILGDLNVARELYDSAEGIKDMSDCLKRDKNESERMQQFRSFSQNVSDFEFLFSQECENWRTATEPRRVVNQWVSQLGFQDTCRLKHPQRMRMYTCWNMKIDARPANYGTRLDYVLLSRGLKCARADILPELYGSDHCPTFADVALRSEGAGGGVGEAVAAAEGAAPPVPSAAAASAKGAESRGSSTNNENNNATECISEKWRRPPPKLCARYLAQFSGRQGMISSFFGKRTASAAFSPAVSKLSKSPKLLTSSINNRTEQPMEKRLSPPPKKKQITATNSMGSKQQTSIKSMFRVRDEPTDNNSGCISPTPESLTGRQQLTVALPQGHAEYSAASPVSGESDISKVKSQWQEILKDKTPLCYHGERCKLLRTKKNGINKGREFWVCARPTGHEEDQQEESSAKNSNSNCQLKYRCNFFKWKN